MKPFPLILLTLAVAVPITWFAASRSHLHSTGSGSASASSQAPGRRLLHYQSAMHPWIKSDKPGRCTICGMELTPVYEGDSGFDGAGGDVVPLSQTMIQVMNVQTAPVEVRPLKKTLPVAGMIDDNATRHRLLSAYIPGRIQKLYVNHSGAEVKEGEPLAEFYSPTLLQAEREYRTLSGELRAATALRLLQMGLTAKQIEALSKKPADQLTSQLLAPVTGTVVVQYAYEGQYVQEGEKLFEIADFSTMWFQFRAYEQDLPWIRPGLQVDITTPSHPGKTFGGTISFIEPNFEETTRSTRVRVELENPEKEGRRLFLHRFYADGLVHLEAPEVLTLPRSAVIETGPEAVAYVDQGSGAYARRVVKLGRRGDVFTEVISGLSAGEKVVVNGNLLIDGQAEMNRSFATPEVPAPSHPASAAASLPALTEPQRVVLRQFLTLVDGLAQALASDNLLDYNRQTTQSAAATTALMGAFGEKSPWHPLAHPIAIVIHTNSAPDLKAARQQFHPLSTGAVALAQALRRGDAGFASLKIFRCPMTREVFEGAPRTADWLQLQPPIRNPWMGSAMLDCGTELKSQ